ncbi:MAG: hypothetical protein L0H38_01655 [bacterium]|nr:hypothetical protein [bacterium]
MLENIRPDVTLHHEAMSTQEVVAQKTQLQPELGSRALKLVEIEQQEQERQRNISQNANRIKKRFGETFVKGEKLQDGGYAGGAARELLADYMEKSNFSDELKRLIPNKHGALDTLRDNQDYIRHQLAELYAGNEAVEKDVPQDPYELAQIASYELTGPFNSVDEFIDRKNDFRSHEVLCTFNSPQDRLDYYHIMWLRHDSADSTLPADELTEENLNEPWKNHLRQTGRYDETTNKYDLADLSPTREDPYGVSSMSVQVSRTGNHVSVKNRYNHTVGSPDSTHKNDLDNLVPGLRLATYHKVDRDDLMYEDLELSLQEGYVLDNDSGIHRYLVEHNNFYLGDYEYVKNGELTTIDRGKYDMLSPKLYLKKDTSGEAITVAYDEDIRTEFEVLDSGAKKVDLYIDKQLQSTYVYAYGDDQPPKIELKVHKYDLVSSNPALTSLTIAEGASPSLITDNPALTNLTIAEGASTGYIINNPALTNLTIAE